ACSASRGSRRTPQPSRVSGTMEARKAVLFMSAPPLGFLAHGGQALHQAQVLFILEQGARQRRQSLVQFLQRVGRHVVGQQQVQPVQEFGGGRFLLQARNIAQGEES